MADAQHSSPANPFAAWTRGADAWRQGLRAAAAANPFFPGEAQAAPFTGEMGEGLRASQRAALDAMTAAAAPLQAMMGSDRLQAELKREAEVTGAAMKWAHERSAAHLKSAEAEATKLRALAEEGAAIGRDGAKSAGELRGDLRANAEAYEAQAQKAAAWSARVGRHQLSAATTAMRTALREAQELGELSLDAMGARIDSAVALQAELARIPGAMLRATQPAAAPAAAAAAPDAPEA